ncbi:hypothetical protein VOLCADRAFT_86022, partial [Volvox carteri f. nagariensis]
VSGLPTNVPFLIRLASHPAFVAAGGSDLNTAFISRYKDELMAPQHVPPEGAGNFLVRWMLLVLVGVRLGWHFSLLGARVQSEAAMDRGGAAAGENPRHHAASVATAATAPSSNPPPEVSVRNARLVNSDTLTAEIGGRKCTAHVLMYDSGSGCAAGIPVEQALDMWLDGEHYHFTWLEPTWSRKAGAAGAAAAGGDSGGGGVGGAVRAPMPGRVVAVLAAEGAAVKAGKSCRTVSCFDTTPDQSTPLLALEAMKMEHSVVAPVDGVVQQLMVGPGMQVAQGQVMAVVGPAATAVGAEKTKDVTNKDSEGQAPAQAGQEDGK